MANAPRADRPPTYRAKRRPSKGNRHVARPMRDRLSIAADLLEKVGNRLESEQQHEEAVEHFNAAADVRAVLAPSGWALLRATAGTTSAKNVNVPIGMAASLRASLYVAAASIGVSLGSVIRDGFRAVKDEQWTPPRLLVDRTRTRPKLDARVNLNVWVPEDLRNEVRDMVPDLSKELGYRVSLSSIGIAWAAEELGVDYPTADVSETLKIVTDKRLIAHWKSEAEERELFIQEIVEDGIKDLMKGSWEPEVPEWLLLSERPRDGGQWLPLAAVGAKEPVPAGKMSVRLGAEALAGLRAWCSSQETEVPFYPGMVLIALLKDRLGEPGAAE